MAKRKVRLKLWVRYETSTGYVWPQIYSSYEDAYIDEEFNEGIKILELTSTPYFSDKTKKPFGTEVTHTSAED